jgi:hypothetical protein
VFRRRHGKLLLAAEVMEERTFGDARSTTQFIDSGSAIALLPELLKSHIKQFVPGAHDVDLVRV